VVYAVVFLGGLAGSLHCVGMCGVFPLALATGNTGRGWVRQLFYNLGRLNTLAVIGALSGATGAALVARGPVPTVERALAIAAGLLMIVVGLETAGLLVQLTGRATALVQVAIGRLLGGVMRSPSPAAPIALGVFNAFLPCQLIYAFAARAASTASIRQGTLIMLCFGLGTVPAMLTLGVTRALAEPLLRARLSRAAALLVIAFGIETLLRGLGVLAHGHPH
jgi:sulfite exporter TauE/SafE